MKNLIRYGFLAFTISVLFVGCATKGSTKKRVNALEAQVGVMTDEIARLDQSLQETRAALAEAHAGGYVSTSSGPVSANTAIYRTPSGFELPSKDIQQALKGAGYYQGAVDGKIGPSTKSAVKAFQQDHGLDADGVVGKGTWNKLKVYLSGGN